MTDITPQEMADDNASRKKLKFPAGRGLFAVGLAATLGVASWFDLLGTSALVLICFLYLVYVVAETTEELFFQVSKLRYEHAILQHRVLALGELVGEIRRNRGGGEDVA